MIYSSPQGMSIFFHYLFSLGVTSDEIIRRFWVFNPDQRLEIRFKGILGSAIHSRYRFFPQTFSQAIGTIQQELENGR